jgi:flagellar basal body-associated protein FliL
MENASPTTNTTPPQKENKKRGAVLFLVSLLVLSIAGNAVLYWMYYNKKSV